jgi:hypothetical protein
MELLLALILFIGMIVSWLMLPGSTTTKVAAEPETGERSASTVGQPA